MTRTQVLQEIRRMRFEEAYGGWRSAGYFVPIVSASW